MPEWTRTTDPMTVAIRSSQLSYQHRIPGENRTHVCGFGDRRPTIGLRAFGVVNYLSWLTYLDQTAERMMVEPTRPSGQTVFETVAATNRLASPSLATHRTNIMRRSPGATRRSLRPGPPRYSAPVLTTRYLALHCDCGGRENRTPIAKGSRVTADAHSTCLPPDPDCGVTRKSSTPSHYVAGRIGKTKAAS